VDDARIEVVDRPEAGRYELRVDGVVAGYADRTVEDGVMVLPHTVVQPAHRGQGLAGRLVRRALDDARAAGLQVLPLCWYVADHIRAHPEERDLVADPVRFGL
jgi:predicted GNAT family acetyltransferase